jgi:hypothetical protein
MKTPPYCVDYAPDLRVGRFRTRVRATDGRRSTGAVALAVLLLGACGFDPDQEATGVTADAIIRGTPVTAASQNPRVAALYHRHLCESGNAGCSQVGQWYWFPRPCSATILRASNAETWVLTARHCVTGDGEVPGTVVSAANLRLNTGLTPGIVAPGASPPSGSVVASNVVTLPVQAGLSNTAGFDLALVRFGVVVQISTRRTSLRMVPPALAGNTVTLLHYGYGRFTNTDLDTEIEDGTTGAGTLRYGKGFRMTDLCVAGGGCGKAGYYEYLNDNVLDQACANGDSGGPGFLEASTSTPFLEQVGVHSKGGSSGIDVMVPGAIAWIEENLGRLYVSPHSSPDYNLAVAGSVTMGAAVNVKNLRDAAETRWIWDPVRRTIYVKDSAGTRFYLTAESDSGGKTYRQAYITKYSVTGGYQSWSLGADGTIRNDALIQTGSSCLRDSATHNAEVSACSSPVTNVTWAWHAQP